MHRILNLGAGTQSSVILLLMDRGEIEPAEVAIFADTNWEPAAVYEHLDWLKEQVSIPIVTVSAGNIYQDAMVSQVGGKEGRCVSMPLYVQQPGSLEQGMIKRQCTQDYKIQPIERYIKREILSLKPRQRWPTNHAVTQVFGLSSDEITRMKAPRRSCFEYEYPLIRMRWPRSMAIQWAKENYPGHEFPRSACVGCPFRSNAEWQNLTAEEFSQAVELDRRIRHADKMRGAVYLHRSMVPLEEADLRTRDQKTGQTFFWQDECEGMCGT